MAFEMIRLNRTAAEPLHEQLYRQIRDELVSASFNNNSSRLPSSRNLATDLQAAKERSGFGDREDIQTWIDLHDAEEGRTPATLFSH